MTREQQCTLAFILIGWVCILALLHGCGGGGENLPPLCETPKVVSSSQYIVDGNPSTDLRSTVQVNGCTGTIVGPHTVLTAAHCDNIRTVYPDGWPLPAYTVWLQTVHPDARGAGRHDLRLVYVEETFPSERISTLAAHQGCTSLLVQGYGQGSDPLDERVVEQVWRGQGIIMTGEATCYGDSGGPLYALQEDGTYSVVAVTSFGTTEDCIDQGSGFTDLTQDGNVEWIRGNLK